MYVIIDCDVFVGLGESEWRERRGVGSETKIVEKGVFEECPLGKIVFCFVFVRVAVLSETNRPSRVSSEIPRNLFLISNSFWVFLNTRIIRFFTSPKINIISILT